MADGIFTSNNAGIFQSVGKQKTTNYGTQTYQKKLQLSDIFTPKTTDSDNGEEEESSSPYSFSLSKPAPKTFGAADWALDNDTTSPMDVTADSILGEAETQKPVNPYQINNPVAEFKAQVEAEKEQEKAEKAGTDKPNYVYYSTPEQYQGIDLDTAKTDIEARQQNISDWNDYVDYAYEQYEHAMQVYGYVQDQYTYEQALAYKEAYENALQNYSDAIDYYNDAAGVYFDAWQVQKPDEVEAYNDNQRKLEWAEEVGKFDEEDNFQLTEDFSDLIQRAYDIEDKLDSIEDETEKQLEQERADFYRTLALTAPDVEEEDFNALLADINDQLGEDTPGDFLAYDPENVEAFRSIDTENVEPEDRKRLEQMREEVTALKTEFIQSKHLEDMLDGATTGDEIQKVVDRYAAEGRTLDHNFRDKEDKILSRYGLLDLVYDQGNGADQNSRDYVINTLEQLSNDPAYQGTMNIKTAYAEIQPLWAQYDVEAQERDTYVNLLRNQRDMAFANEAYDELSKNDKVADLLKAAHDNGEASVVTDVTDAARMELGAESNTIISDAFARMIATELGVDDATARDKIYWYNRAADYNAYADAENGLRKTWEERAKARPTWETLKTVGRQTYAGIESVVDIINQRQENWRAGEDDRTLNLYSGGQMDRRSIVDTRETVGAEIQNGNRSFLGLTGEEGRFMYESATSAADSSVNMALATGLALALTPAGAAAAGGFLTGDGIGAIGLAIENTAGASLVRAGMVDVIMGSSVMSDSIYNSILSGEDPNEALLKGFVEGAIEGLTEAIGGEKVSNLILRADFGAKELASSLMAEGIEEVMGNWMTRYADRMWFNAGRKSEFQKLIETAKSMGMGDKAATEYAIMQYANEDVQSFLAGALSALMSNAGAFGTRAAGGAVAANEYRKAGVGIVQGALMNNGPSEDAPMGMRPLVGSFANQFGEVTITQNGNNKFVFHITDAEGKSVVNSRTFGSKEAAAKAGAKRFWNDFGGTKAARAYYHNIVFKGFESTETQQKYIDKMDSFFIGSTLSTAYTETERREKAGLTEYTPVGQEILHFTDEKSKSSRNKLTVAQAQSVANAYEAIDNMDRRELNRLTGSEITEGQEEGKISEQTARRLASVMGLFNNPVLREYFETTTGIDIDGKDYVGAVQAYFESVFQAREVEAEAQAQEAQAKAQQVIEQDNRAKAFQKTLEKTTEQAGNLLRTGSELAEKIQLATETTSAKQLNKLLTDILKNPSLKSSFEAAYMGGQKLPASFGEARRAMRAALRNAGSPVQVNDADSFTGAEGLSEEARAAKMSEWEMIYSVQRAQRQDARIAKRTGQEGYSANLDRVIRNIAKNSTNLGIFNAAYGSNIKVGSKGLLDQIRAVIASSSFDTVDLTQKRKELGLKRKTEASQAEGILVEVDGTTYTREQFVRMMVQAGTTVEDADKAFDVALDQQRDDYAGVSFDDNIDTTKLTERQRTSVRVLEEVGKRLGVDFHFFESPVDERGRRVGANGYYNPKDGRIYLDLYAGIDGRGLILYTAAHELTHWMRANNEDGYRNLLNVLSREYTRHGRSLNEMIERQQQKAIDNHNVWEQRKREAEAAGREYTVPEPELLDWDAAREEAVADSMESMLTDGSLIDLLDSIQSTDLDLHTSIVSKLLELADKVREAYHAFAPDSREGRMVREMDDAFEPIRRAYAEGLLQTRERMDERRQAEEQATEVSEAVEGDPILDGKDPDEASEETVTPEEASKFSYRSLAEAAGFVAVNPADPNNRYWIRENDERVEEVTEDDIRNSPIGALIDISDISEEDKVKEVRLFRDICNMAIGTNDFALTMQGVGSVLFTAMKLNSDAQYGTTYDFPSICTKTQAVVDSMSARMVEQKRGLTPEEITALYSDVFENGLPVPCPECYVFSRWVGIGGLLDNLYKYQTKYGGILEEEGEEKGKQTILDEYKATRAEVEAAAEELGLTAGKAKSKLTATITNEYTKLEEKISKADNQGQEVKQADRDKLAELEKQLVKVKSLVWLEEVFFAGQNLEKATDASKLKINPRYNVPVEVLFDLNRGEDFAGQYPEAWGWRTTQGAGYGKAITPYAEAVLGEGILVTSGSGAIKAKTAAGRAGKRMTNPFLNSKGKLTDAAKKKLKNAIQKQLNQAFLGGQRMQSTSDARFENVSDYILAALEMQAMGARSQIYTKVDGAVPFLSLMGGSVNMSMMPKGDGMENGVPEDTRVGGMSPAVAQELRKQFPTAGTITIGVNDAHIRALYRQAWRDFIIPYHASGGKAELVAGFRAIQDPKDAEKAKIRSVDYSRTQNDKVLSDDVLRSLGYSSEDISLIHDRRKARIDILTGKSVDMDVVNGSEFLSELYHRVRDKDGEWYGVKLAKGKIDHAIFPNEFWDKSLTYEQSGQITEDYLAYCEELGFLHRFSGMVPRNGELKPVYHTMNDGTKVALTDLAYQYNKNGERTNEVEDFFWKNLVDHRMYDNDGNYIEQRQINMAGLVDEQADGSTVGPAISYFATTEAHRGAAAEAARNAGTRVYDPVKSAEVARANAARDLSEVDTSRFEDKLKFSMRSVDTSDLDGSGARGWYGIETKDDFANWRIPMFKEDAEDEESKALMAKAAGKNRTSQSSTTATYQKLGQLMQKMFPDRWQDLRVLDASSGRGLGTEALRAMGFNNAEDIEPFNDQRLNGGDETAPQNYTDYGRLEDMILNGEVEPFDFIISNAVFNVMAQDDRINMAASLANLLAPGGYMFVNSTIMQPSSWVENTEENRERVRNNERLNLMLNDKMTLPDGTRVAPAFYVFQSGSIQHGNYSEELINFFKDVIGDEYYTYERAKDVSDLKSLKLSGDDRILIHKSENAPVFTEQTPARAWSDGYVPVGVKMSERDWTELDTEDQGPADQASNLTPEQVEEADAYKQTEEYKQFKTRMENLFGEGCLEDMRYTAAALKRAVERANAKQTEHQQAVEAMRDQIGSEVRAAVFARQQEQKAQRENVARAFRPRGTTAPVTAAPSATTQTERDMQRTIDRLVRDDVQEMIRRESAETEAEQLRSDLKTQRQEAKAEAKRQRDVGYMQGRLEQEGKDTSAMIRDGMRWQDKLNKVKQQAAEDLAREKEKRATERAEARERLEYQKVYDDFEKQSALIKQGERDAKKIREQAEKVAEVKQRNADQRTLSTKQSKQAMSDLRKSREDTPNPENSDVTIKYASDEELTREERWQALKDKFNKAGVKARQIILDDIAPLRQLGMFQRRTTWTGPSVESLTSQVKKSGAISGLIITDKLIDREGNTIAGSFNDVFYMRNEDGTIDKEATDLLRRYLHNWTTVDSMSIKANMRKQVEAFIEQNPWLAGIDPAEFALLVANREEAAQKAAAAQLAKDEQELRRMEAEIESWHVHNHIAIEFNKLLQRYNKAQDKPIYADADGKPVSAETAQAVIDEMDMAAPWLRERAQAVWDWYDQFMQNWAVGISISAEEYAFMQAIHPHYCPALRVNLDKGGASLLGSYNKGTGTTKATRERTGSLADLMAPDSAYANLIQTIVKKARVEEMSNVIYDTVQLDMEENDGENFRGRVEILEDGLVQDEDSIDPVDEMEEDTVDDGASILASGKGPNAPYRINVWKNGQRAHMLVSHEIGTAYKNLLNVKGDTAADRLVASVQNVGNFLTSPMKAMVTGYNIWFGMRNVVRDVPNYLINSVAGWGAFRYWIQAWKEIEMINRAGSENWERFKALGGEQFGYHANESGLNGNTFAAEKAAEKETGVKGAWHGFLEKLGWFNETTESVTRFAEYLATIDKYGDSYEGRLQGIQNAAEVTVDFSRHGTAGRVINAWIPYWNPGVQGLDKIIRTIVGDEQNIKAVMGNAAGTISRAMVFQALPEILIFAALKVLGKDKDWEELSDYVKDNYYCIPIDDHRFLKIPKNREWAAVLGSSTSRMLQGLNGRQDIWDNYFDIDIKGNFLPNGPTDIIGFSQWFDLRTNENYAGTPIVSGKYKDYTSGQYASNENIWDENTSVLAMGLSKLFANAISPVQADYIISSYCGDMVTSLITAVDMGVVDGKDTIIGNVGEAFQNSLSSWITDNRYSNAYTSRLYELLDELGTQVQDDKLADPEGYKDGTAYQIRYVLNKYSTEIGTINKNARDLTEVEQIAAKAESAAMAQEAIEFYERAMSGEIENPRLYYQYQSFSPVLRDELISLEPYASEYTFEPSSYKPTQLADPGRKGNYFYLDDTEREQYGVLYDAYYNQAMTALIQTAAYRNASMPQRLEMMEDAYDNVRANTTAAYVDWISRSGKRSEPKRK